MALIAATTYDPAARTTRACTSTAMTAFDTANLRLTFNAPKTGNVTVRILCPIQGTSAVPAVFFGVLEGATVRRRVPPSGGGNWSTGSNNTIWPLEAIFTVTGLTPGQSYTWDAAYGVEIQSTSMVLGYGGPNDATDVTALGAFLFEVWEA